MFAEVLGRRRAGEMSEGQEGEDLSVRLPSPGWQDVANVPPSHQGQSQFVSRSFCQDERNQET